MIADLDTGNKELWGKDEIAFFEYHCLRSHDSADRQLWYRDHQEVSVNSIVENGLDGTFDERLSEGSPRVYNVTFKCGKSFDVFEDELFTSADFYTQNLENPDYCFID